VQSSILLPGIGDFCFWGVASAAKARPSKTPGAARFSTLTFDLRTIQPDLYPRVLYPLFIHGAPAALVPGPVLAKPDPGQGRRDFAFSKALKKNFREGRGTRAPRPALTPLPNPLHPPKCYKNSLSGHIADICPSDSFSPTFSLALFGAPILALLPQPLPLWLDLAQ
jgi:hypothetical protein